MTFYPQILNPSQQQLLTRLGFMAQSGFYLAGGTALALQIGHRTSLDFDFYSAEKFDGLIISEKIKSLGGGEVTEDSDTLHAVVNGISLSGFYYPYFLVDKLVDFETLKLASIADIAAMKVIAVIQRARQRDFFDMYYLIKTLGLAEIVKHVYRKYPWYEENNQIIFTALTYFEDAENDDELSRVKVFDKGVTWGVVKEFLREAVEATRKKIAN